MDPLKLEVMQDIAPIHAPPWHSHQPQSPAQQPEHMFAATAMQAPSTHHAGTSFLPPVSSLFVCRLEVRPACWSPGRYVMQANDA